MDLLVIHNRLNFLINKAIGEYFTPEEIDDILDQGQMAVFNDYYLKFTASQRIDDALAPFAKKFTFTYTTTPGGVVTAPTDYFDQVSIRTIVQDANGNTKERPCPRLNTNEITDRLNSQIYPPTLMDPISETIQSWNIQLYPKQPQAGVLSYLARPAAPKISYTFTNRVFAYDANASTQMQWADKDIQSILLKSLSYIGISVREADVITWSDQEDSQNVLTPNKA